MASYDWMDDLIASGVISKSDEKKYSDFIYGDLAERKGRTSPRKPIPNKAKELVEIMNHFTKNETELKYTTHRWEYDRYASYDDFMTKVKKEWDTLALELQSINPSLYQIIFDFLFVSEDVLSPSDHNLNSTLSATLSATSESSANPPLNPCRGKSDVVVGWSSHFLKDYMQNHTDPFTCSIPQNIRTLSGRNDLVVFKDYVDILKNKIEIREDCRALRTILNQIWEDLIPDFNVDMSNLNGISFFTNVEQLTCALKGIFDNISSRKTCPNVEISTQLITREHKVVLSIIQLNSECTRPLDHPKISSLQGGGFSTIIKSFNNLADFSIASYFRPDKMSYRLNYLSSSRKLFKECIVKPRGFTYELTFYL